MSGKKKKRKRRRAHNINSMILLRMILDKLKRNRVVTFFFLFLEICILAMATIYWIIASPKQIKCKIYNDTRSQCMKERIEHNIKNEDFMEFCVKYVDRRQSRAEAGGFCLVHYWKFIIFHV